jgi:hypothetical protein
MPVWAASYTASVVGYWDQPATWGGQGPPANGDTVSINDGVTVFVQDSRIVGASAPAGTLAINCNNTGTIYILSGATLTVRGDIAYTAGANYTPYIIVQGGGAFVWDSSQASSPGATKYSAHASATSGYRPFSATGTKTNHASVSSNPGGANGYFTTPGTGGSYVTTYTDFLRIGDASTPAFYLWSDNVSAGPEWSAVHDTFTSCGEISTAGSMSAIEIFQHDFNVHTGSLGPAVLNRYGYNQAVAAMTTGTRELIGNVFDIGTSGYSVGDATVAFDARDFNIHSNYFAGPLNTVNYQSYTWRYFQNNFYILPVGTGNSFLTLMGDARDNLFFLNDPNAMNPHGLNLSAYGPETMYGDIVDHGGQIQSQVSAWMISNNAVLAPGTYVMSNNLLLPNASGNSSWYLAAPIQMAGENGTVFWINHNTAMVNNTNQGVGVLVAHPGTLANPAGQLASFQSNILWNPVAANQAYKLLAAQNINSNVCSPASCNYNDGWNMLTDGGAAGGGCGGAGCTGGANGYADNFSGGTPGANDLSVNPNFVDPTRNTATFDSVYLGNTDPAWSSGTTYAVGALVSSADSTVYAGTLINYRYINASYNGTACAGANPKPGLYTAAARACWEWATLYDLRQAVGAQTLTDDQTIGAHGVDLITVLIQWIRAGFSPTNPALALVGNDGQDIGAVPISFAGPPQVPTIPGAPTRGTIRKGVVR